MPTYAYACLACGHRFDIYQAFSDDALTECPECGGTLRKQFGNVGVVFKGSGFYRNDARSSSSTTDTTSSSTSKDSATTSSSSSSSESSSSSTTSTASTPAAKPAASSSTAKAASA